MITPEILLEFKERMHLEGDEDKNLMRILKASEKELRRVCGNYNIKTDEVFKELVFERSRYAYNDALEYFKRNFQTEINSLGMEKALEELDEEVTEEVLTEEDIEKLDEQDFIRYGMSDDDATI